MKDKIIMQPKTIKSKTKVVASLWVRRIQLLGTILLAKIAIFEIFGYNMFVTFRALQYLNGG
jgi:hypothetical protein